MTEKPAEAKQAGVRGTWHCKMTKYLQSTCKGQAKVYRVWECMGSDLAVRAKGQRVNGCGEVEQAADG